MDVISGELENVIQTSFIHPQKESPCRDTFETDYAKLGFERTMKKYGLMGWRYQILQYKKNLHYKIHTIKSKIKNLYESWYYYSTQI